MRIRFVLSSVVVGLVLCAGLFGGRAAAQSIATAGGASDVSASIVGHNPLDLRMRLKNISTHTCQVATTAQGTIAVTNVMQNGKQLPAVALNTASDDDLGYLLQSQLKAIKPGQSADLPLLIYKVGKSYVLRTTTWSDGAGSLGSQYVIQSDKPLKLDLNYSLPITPQKGAVACGGVFASSISGGGMSVRKLLVGAAILAVAVLILLVIWWLAKRKHHKKPVVAAAVLLGLSLAVWHHAPRALADISVPPSAQAAFNTCMGVLNANRDLTGPVLDVINNPANHIIIVPISGTGSDMTGYDHTFTIYWNPNDHHPYAGTGGNADPCTTLYHEMYHAYDMSSGTFSRDDCAGSGIETKEVMATRAQNALRVRLGLPPRSHYGDRPLPSGDCHAPAHNPECSGVHCASTNGDPHLRTFDGLLYDFQGAGEFTAAQDTTGAYQIQVRQQPFDGSKYVAVNTAIAFKINGDKVEIRAGQAMVLVVNGKQRSLVSTTLPKGGTLTMDEGVAVLTWLDGSKAYVRSVGSYGLALSAQLSDNLAGKVSGLLGDANGDPKDDLHLRGSSKTIQPTFAELYPKFADSWRITAATSLFTYPGGKSTATYTNHNFPAELPKPTSLPNYASALAFCKSFGIADPTVLANCALDVALTGRPEFARSAAETEAFAAGADFGGTTWNLSFKNPGDKADVTFTAKAGEKIFVQIPQSTLDSQCGTLNLLGPDNSEISSGCIINGSGEIDGTVLPADGQYTIHLEPTGPAGTATVRLLRITDKQGTITPDGATITANIDKPGVVARYTFNGQAGQHLYLDVPSSTLISQCGILQLIAPDGSDLTSGCVINGSGDIDTTTLPANGQYTVVLDPTDTATGTARLHLIVATAATQAITMNGSTLTANLAKPGSTAQFAFSGVAGQKIYVDIPHSDLPSECGVLTLRQPDGSVVSSGCIINGSGNLDDSATLLPVTGQYTLVLDPNGNVTGKTTIRLRDH